MRDLESPGREELLQIILDQHRLIEQLRTEIEQLKKRGSAAPFSKGTRKANPKAPGRKPGQGYFRFRTAVEESKTGRARQFSRTLKELLQRALELSAKKNELDAAAYKKQVGELNLHPADDTESCKSPQ
jgi:hypothetical protein